MMTTKDVDDPVIFQYCGEEYCSSCIMAEREQMRAWIQAVIEYGESFQLCDDAWELFGIKAK